MSEKSSNRNRTLRVLPEEAYEIRVAVFGYERVIKWDAQTALRRAFQRDLDELRCDLCGEKHATVIHGAADEAL